MEGCDDCGDVEEVEDSAVIEVGGVRVVDYVPDVSVARLVKEIVLRRLPVEPHRRL